jgi:hypothetical protein
MSNSPYSISKTSFLKFDQCSKAFFLYKNFPYLRDKIGVDKQLTFKRGHDVGFFAQQLFPGGRDVSKETKNAAEALALTATLIAEKVPVIYEATFVFNGVLIMADILCLSEEKYTAYEIKSSLKVSETYIKDACLQYYVLKNTLPGFDDLFLVTLNPDYVREAEIEPKKLFKKRSIRQKAEENFTFFEHKLQEAYLVLEKNAIPDIAIGRHCFRPYQCDYFGTCWKNTVHDQSIFNLPLVGKEKLFEWYSSGIRNIDQLSDAQLEKDYLIRIKNAFTSNAPIIDHEKIKEFLARIRYPVAAMDMEIWSPAIPQITGTRPFEQIPFLVCFYNGTDNSYFFTENKPDSYRADGRREFAQGLIELASGYASILVYDKTMELGVMESLIRNYPDLKAPLEELKTKLVDVFDVFLGLFYYHPEFKSNFSLKAAAGYLLQDISYPKISSGLEAMNYFEQLRLSDPGLEKESLKEDLVNYCQTDTIATFKLAEFLKGLVSSPFEGG